MFNSIIFDVDSTIVTIEGLLEIAHYKGLNHEIEVITNQGNNGEISFDESLQRRIELIRPSMEDLDWLSSYYLRRLTPGVEGTIAVLKQLQLDVYLVSGSFTRALYGLQEMLGIVYEHCFANEIEFDSQGNFVRLNMNQPLTKNGGKKNILEKLQPARKVAFVGDGSTDLETKEYVDLFIGFGGVVERQIVKEAADKYIYELYDVVELIS